MDESDIGHPQLVDAVQLQAFDQVRVNRQPVVAVGGANQFFLLRPAKPAVAAHDARNLLVIDPPAFAFELGGHTPISIIGKIQASLLHTREQRFVSWFLLRLVIASSPGKIHQFTPPFNVFDQGAIVGNELALFCACLRLLRNAFLKIHFPGRLCATGVEVYKPGLQVQLAGMAPDQDCSQYTAFSRYTAARRKCCSAGKAQQHRPIH